MLCKKQISLLINASGYTFLSSPKKASPGFIILTIFLVFINLFSPGRWKINGTMPVSLKTKNNLMSTIRPDLKQAFGNFGLLGN
ncbi:hypothetical protein FKM82_014643 [Ascaphus truei]